MARPSRRYIEEMAKDWEPRLRDAFLDAIQDIRAAVTISALADFLERGDINGALRAVGLEPNDFRLLENAVASTFNAGGIATANRIPPLRSPEGYRLQVRFDARNIAAESWLRTHSARLVGGIVDDQRAAIRAHLLAGMEAGKNPRTVALDLVGRIDRMSGQRIGGVIGLSSRQEEWLRAYERELSDPATMAGALKRGLRDRRFDRSVQRAAREGVAIAADVRARMLTAYKNNALRFRAETIARTEAFAALGEAQEQAFRQAIDKGVVDPEAVVGVWHTAKDERVRKTHAAMHGQQVGWEESFQSPSGATLRFPG